MFNIFNLHNSYLSLLFDLNNWNLFWRIFFYCKTSVIANIRVTQIVTMTKIMKLIAANVRSTILLYCLVYYTCILKRDVFVAKSIWTFDGKMTKILSKHFFPLYFVFMLLRNSVTCHFFQRIKQNENDIVENISTLYSTNHQPYNQSE